MVLGSIWLAFNFTKWRSQQVSVQLIDPDHPSTVQFMSPNEFDSLSLTQSLAMVGPNIPKISIGCLNLLASFTAVDLRKFGKPLTAKDGEYMAMSVLRTEELLDTILERQHEQGCMEFPPQYTKLHEYGELLWGSCYKAKHLMNNNGHAEPLIRTCVSSFIWFRAHAALALTQYLPMKYRSDVRLQAKSALINPANPHTIRLEIQEIDNETVIQTRP